MSHLTETELATLKKALLAKGRDLSDKLAALMAGKRVTIDELLNPKPGETPEERVRRYLDEVDRRIKAIARGDGSYGRCAACDAPLAYAELEQLPWADRCRACAARNV